MNFEGRIIRYDDGSAAAAGGGEVQQRRMSGWFCNFKKGKRYATHNIL